MDVALNEHLKEASRAIRTLLVATLIVGCAGVKAAQSTAIVISDVTLIDGTGALPGVTTVVVEGDRIVAIARSGRERPPAHATIVDGRGKYLIPGMWDMHVHIGIGGYEDGTKILTRLIASATWPLPSM